MRDVGVLGGGISGLFTAYFLGGDVEVLEADATPGGLARCFGGEGFRSDIGGHILFSKDKEALAHELAVLGDNRRRSVRANKILYQGLHVKYPFENGIDVLPKEDIVDILHSFIDNPHKAKPTNFREWMYHVFGNGLTDATPMHVIIVIQIDGETVGLLADRVLDIIAVDASQIQPVPKVSHDPRTGFLSGLVAIETTMIALIDLKSLLAS